MTVDKNGNVITYKITPSIIRSKKRYTYTEVQNLLDTGENALINAMDELRQILRTKRERRGALDFDLPESKITVDENGQVTAIEPYPRNNATAIIEEFMILCNETIATHFLSQKIPFIYRTHDAPSPEKLISLQTLIENIGLSKETQKSLKSPAPSSSAIQKLLETAKETPAAYAISAAVLRALPQARYTPDNPTHFGLASKAYCHFTSPIRRYADLQIHRIIKMSKALEESLGEILPAVAAQCSRTERTAEALEREVADLKKVQFMANKEGQTFNATVSGLTPWGIFIMLENTAEGLVPTANLIRHGYKFNKELSIYEKKRRKGESPTPPLTHGAPIKVRLVSANEDERKLTFALKY
jgi:ribonuclease R